MIIVATTSLGTLLVLFLWWLAVLLLLLLLHQVSSVRTHLKNRIHIEMSNSYWTHHCLMLTITYNHISQYSWRFNSWSTFLQVGIFYLPQRHAGSPILTRSEGSMSPRSGCGCSGRSGQISVWAFRSSQRDRMLESREDCNLLMCPFWHRNTMVKDM